MHPEYCVDCKRCLHWQEGYRCDSCQKKLDRQRDHALAHKMKKPPSEGGFDMWDDQEFQEYIQRHDAENYHLPYAKMRPEYYASEDNAARREREARARKERDELAAKQARIRAGLGNIKECSACGCQAPHDLDDYQCIVCRDGRGAVPAGYLHYWVEAA